ncbi:peptidase U32 family protein [Culicoidibacter larvae]|uniref:U32 family peptidase n=1 Tax=Culicoidibacter larvae TaxID=2579976 RepID=A0A5R8QER2_9FIRM|nr:U32 family peptidase [Culicoidibacter larvae]TLG74277.1 U32 family peptidase [Culicoidibacter larvae]
MRRVVSEIIDGKRIITKKPELLAPAGNLEKLKIAVMYGADAVFIGGQKFGLRANADNFSIDEIAEGVRFANEYNAKIYVTTNIFAHNSDMHDLAPYLKDLEDAGVTGIIVADPYIIETCKVAAPKLELHLSTQQSLTNWKAAEFWKEQGMDRLVLAREMTKEEIQQVLDHVDVEIETFIHGAMCIAYSGRCTLSNHMTSRDSNRGGCCQSCRWEYDLVQETDSGDLNKLNTDKNQYTMSPMDLNLLTSVPQMIEMGIDSLKIEGRMKSIHYVATVVSVYRKVIDAYCADPDNFELSDDYIEELKKCANRETAPSFFEGVPTHQEQLFNHRDEHPTKEFIGIVLEYDETKQMLKLEQRNYFKPGDTIEFFGPHMDNLNFVVGDIFNEDMEAVDAARHPQEIIYMPLPFKVLPQMMMRKVK